AAAGNGNVVAVTWTGGTSVLSNAGVISATAGSGNSRAVDTGALAAGSSLTVLNAAAATIVSSTNDAIRINSDIPNGSILIDNAGFIVSGAVDAGGTITGARSGQALDLNALVSSSVHTHIVNAAGGLIGAANADAIRPGVNATIENHGAIRGQSA